MATAALLTAALMGLLWRPVVGMQLLHPVSGALVVSVPVALLAARWAVGRVPASRQEELFIGLSNTSLALAAWGAFGYAFAAMARQGNPESSWTTLRVAVVVVILFVTTAALSRSRFQPDVVPGFLGTQLVVLLVSTVMCCTAQGVFFLASGAMKDAEGAIAPASLAGLLAAAGMIVVLVRYDVIRQWSFNRLQLVSELAIAVAGSAALSLAAVHVSFSVTLRTVPDGSVRPFLSCAAMGLFLPVVAVWLTILRGRLRRVRVHVLAIALAASWIVAGSLTADRAQLKRAHEHTARAVAAERTEDYGEALGHWREVLAHRRSASPRHHEAVAEALHGVGRCLFRLARYEDALPPLVECRSRLLKELAPEHPSVLSATLTLMIVTAELGRMDEARELVNSVPLEVWVEATEGNPSLQSTATNVVARMLIEDGDEVEAERLLLKTAKLPRPRGQVGLEAYVLVRLNLSLLYMRSSRFAEAWEALDEAEQALAGASRPLLEARVKEFRSCVDFMLGRYDEAARLLLETIALKRAAQGHFHPDTAKTVRGLATVYLAQGELVRAKRTLEEAKEVLLRELGSDSPDWLWTEFLGGLVAFADGDADEAERLFDDAARTWTRLFGERQSMVAEAHEGRARALAALGRNAEAGEEFAHALEIGVGQLEDTFAVLTERQKVTAVVGFTGHLHRYLRHTLETAKDDAAAVARCYSAWLATKGLVLDAQAQLNRAVLAGDDEQTRQLWRDYRATREQLAQLWFSNAQVGDDGSQRRQLEVRAKELEKSINELVGEGDERLGRTRPDVVGVARSLPAGTVFVDFARVGLSVAGEREAKAPRYVAFALRAGDASSLQLLDLGEAAAVDQLVASYLGSIQPGTPPLVREQLSRRLSQSLIGPAAHLLAGATGLILSPDGALWQVPFPALTWPEGGYLADRFDVTFTPSGRDLDRGARSAAGPVRDALILMDPDYDALVDTAAAGSSAGWGSSGPLAGFRFGPLPGTRVEGTAVQRVLEAAGVDVSSWAGPLATEAVVRVIRGPGVLHLATHGYYIPPQYWQRPNDLPLGLLPVDIGGLPAHAGDSPLSRSGVALAGANHGLAAGSDTGLLTAEKILGLDLRGTRLVVLSACQTGLGDIQNGDGVFGLTRSLLVAGADAAIVSLWSVSDEATAELMVEFYREWTRGRGTSDALRTAQVRIRERYGEPAYWAPFILVGGR